MRSSEEEGLKDLDDIRKTLISGLRQEIPSSITSRNIDAISNIRVLIQIKNLDTKRLFEEIYDAFKAISNKSQKQTEILLELRSRIENE